MGWQEDEITKREKETEAARDAETIRATERELIYNIWQRFLKENEKLNPQLRLAIKQADQEYYGDTIMELRSDRYSSVVRSGKGASTVKLACQTSGSHQEYEIFVVNGEVVFQKVVYSGNMGTLRDWICSYHLDNHAFEKIIKNMCTGNDIADGLKIKQVSPSEEARRPRGFWARLFGS